MPIETVSLTAADAGKSLVRSLRDTGFAVLRDHGLPQSLLENIYKDWKAFFLSEEKFAFQFDTEQHGSQHGFYPADVSETAVGHDQKDLKEFFHVVPGELLPDQLAEDIMAYRQIAFALGQQLVGQIQENLGDDLVKTLPEPLPDMLSSEASLLRVLHYPPVTGGEHRNAVRAAAHEDINLITLLPVADQPGLQVQNTAGQWLDVASVRGELIVNNGDMLQELTGGMLPSTSHRVVNPGGEIANESRISLPFFLTPRLEIKLSDRYTAGGYLEERLSIITRQ